MFTEEPYILQISLRYFDAFKNYNYLNLNVHFSSEQVIKLRNAMVSFEKRMAIEFASSKSIGL